jgi:uncharacterized membrane protein YoaK (UPF0700 family)
LGRVFVANMTGNVVFLGFALAGAPGFSLAPSLAALVGFLAGALAGGRLVQRWAGHRRLLLRNITALDLVLVALATAIAGSPRFPRQTRRRWRPSASRRCWWWRWGCRTPWPAAWLCPI